MSRTPDEFKPQTYYEKLHDAMVKRFGGDWRVTLSINLRVDVLTWLVYLAEKGLESERQKRKLPDGRLTVLDAANCSSWELNIEELVQAVEKGEVVPPPPSKRGKKS